jgi:putative endonuclease
VKTFFVYMMTNRSRVVLYTGVTNSLERRIWFHRNDAGKSFTKTYNVDRLVYYEQFNEARYAIAREKEIKGWRREKKNDLVRTLNPKWKDLGRDLFDPNSGKVTRRGTLRLTAEQTKRDLHSCVRSLAVCAARDHALTHILPSQKNRDRSGGAHFRHALTQPLPTRFGSRLARNEW